MTRALALGLAALCALAFATPLVAAAAAPAAASAREPRIAGQPDPGSTLRDREFGVATRLFGLQRHVEMYQWRRGDDGRYRALWWDRPVDSSSYGEAHRNPGAFPLPTRYWIAERSTLDDKPIDDEVLKALGTWRTFRPGFTALPGNLAATFQPDGDGLSSAENPLDPQIGDLRVTWREMALPALQGRIALQDGTWRIAPDRPAAARVSPAAQATASAPVARAAASNRWPAWLALAVIAVGVIAWLLRARRRRIAG